MRGDAERRALMRGPITLDHLIAADTPSGKSSYAEKALSALSPRFHGMYSAGRPSIPPEHLVKGSALIALYSIRSERQFCERIYDLLFKWFVDLNIMEPAFDASSFSKNKERLLEHDVARHFLNQAVDEARRRRLLSDDHFTVDFRGERRVPTTPTRPRRARRRGWHAKALDGRPGSATWDMC